MERAIKCENANGYSMEFNEREFAPFLLAKASGIYADENTVYTENNTMIDGAEYLGTTKQARNIVLTLKEKDHTRFADNRDAISVLFDKSISGILTVTEDTHERQIEYQVESINTTAAPKVRLTTVSLICPNPYFTDTFDTKKAIMDIQDNFEFPHEFLEEGEEFAYVNDDKLITIVNNSAETNIGLTITFTTSGTVVNPALIKVETAEKLAVGTAEKQFTLHAEDKLIFTTATGQKNVYVISEDGTKTEINEYLTYDSSFIQLQRGRNTFGMAADEGFDYLAAVVAYRYKYARA